VPRRVAFHRDDPGPAVAVLARLTERGEGWANFASDLGEGNPDRESGGFFSGRGPRAPHATYVPARPRRTGRSPSAQLGIEHAAGPKAARRLADGGLPVPPSWRVRQDHPKRGLVLDVPADAEPASVIDWLLAAAGLLASVPLADGWLAEVWEPADRP
jgi:hypothetical protein